MGVSANPAPGRTQEKVARTKATDTPRVSFGALSTQRRMALIGKLAVALLGAFISLFPVAYIVGASFNATNSLSDIIPQQATFNNYEKIVTDTQFPVLLWLFNSVKVSVISTLIIVALTTMAAFAFSRLEWRGRQSGLLVIMLIQLFPNTLALVSLYLLLLQIGGIIPWLGLNSHGGLILIYAGGALGLNTWMLKGFFDTLPKELDESAKIDGASRSQTFYMILLPLLRPILAVVAILTFIGTYADFLIAHVMLTNKDQYTLGVGLNLLIQDQFSRNWGQFAAAALVGALPVVVLFLVLQKQLISGLTSGSVKG
jgi:arabinogalactan oligomer / maltooligosaccharide transport system permease protein